MGEIAIGNVRFSYVSIWEPRANLAGQMKYGVSVLVPKADKKSVALCEKAISDAIDAGIAAGKLPKAQKKIVQSPLRDGDLEFEVQKKDENYQGMVFFNAYSDSMPSIVDKHGNPIIDRELTYSGMWGVVAVNFYFTNKGGEPRVAVGLNHVMKQRDDDRMDNRTNVADAFAAFIQQADDDDGDGTEMV